MRVLLVVVVDVVAVVLPVRLSIDVAGFKLSLETARRKAGGELTFCCGFLRSTWLLLRRRCAFLAIVNTSRESRDGEAALFNRFEFTSARGLWFVAIFTPFAGGTDRFTAAF